jgi:predicted MFS family arabinose efflux permease
MPIRSIAMLLACGFLFNGASASCRAFVFAYMDTTFRLPTSVVGVISSLGLFAGILAALNGPRLARRFGGFRTMVIAAIGQLIFLSPMALIGHWAAAAVGTIGVLAMASVFWPAYQVAQMEMAAPDLRPLLSGASLLTVGLGFATTSLSGGVIVATLGFRNVFVLGAGLAAGAALLLWQLAKQDSPRQIPP